ncbi:MAG TPA: copper homeostasis protein CutC [Saprospiraceae bacterium]|nr:copper homeostasis protein CutC [Saprospiraceae bacterium]HMQ85224.1 copper homeostasis protein CutC [Saprospiraceae bacterium]
MTLTKPKLEACVDTLADALRAEAAGADRIELCSRLDLDGLSPSVALLAEAQATLSIPIHAMVRPRAGDFCYTDSELAEMALMIDQCKALGVAGVVFGLLKADGRIDRDTTRYLAALAKPMQVCFHKAIDQTPDPVVALEQLLDIPEIDIVLSSGGAPTALEGQATLNEMIRRAKGQLIVMAAGKVTQENLSEVMQRIPTEAYHGRRIVC